MRIHAPALLLAALLLPGCAAARRGADNGIVVATVPVHVLTDPMSRFADGWKKDPLSTSATAPFLVPIWMARDLFFTGVSAVDLALTPLYIPWKTHRPRLYDIRTFPPRLRPEVAKGSAEAAAGTICILAPVAAFVLATSGKGTWNPPPTVPPPYPDR